MIGEQTRALAGLVSDLSARFGLPPSQGESLQAVAGEFGGACFGTPAPALRRPSMHHDGTPVQLSASLLPAGSGGVRIAFEPGPLSEPVSAQIARSLLFLDGLLARLGWAGCAPALNAVAGAVFPSDAAEVDHWWGGMWVGFQAHPEKLGLRAYFNLRAGDALTRWRRVGAVFAALAGEPASGALQEVLGSAAGRAMPVGLGLDLAGVPRALKVYVGVNGASPAVIDQLSPAGVGAPAREAVRSLLEPLAPGGGPLPDQSVTCAYDVALDRNGSPDGGVRRFKVDVDAVRLLPDDAESIQLARRLAHAYDLQTGDLDRLLEAAAPYQDGRRAVQYIGLGLGSGLVNLNLYLRPGGLAPAGPGGGLHG